jgi:hypothetical protein
MFHLYEDATILGQGLQNIGITVSSKSLCLWAGKDIFIVPLLLWQLRGLNFCGPAEDVKQTDYCFLDVYDIHMEVITLTFRQDFLYSYLDVIIASEGLKN